MVSRSHNFLVGLKGLILDGFLEDLDLLDLDEKGFLMENFIIIIIIFIICLLLSQLFYCRGYPLAITIAGWLFIMLALLADVQM